MFSAPNYCYRCGNQGAILEIGENMDFSMCGRRGGVSSRLQFNPAPVPRDPELATRAPDFFPHESYAFQSLYLCGCL